jgi:hypothetical protein
VTRARAQVAIRAEVSRATGAPRLPHLRLERGVDGLEQHALVPQRHGPEAAVVRHARRVLPLPTHPLVPDRTTARSLIGETAHGEKHMHKRLAHAPHKVINAVGGIGADDHVPIKREDPFPRDLLPQPPAR